MNPQSLKFATPRSTDVLLRKNPLLQSYAANEFQTPYIVKLQRNIHDRMKRMRTMNNANEQYTALKEVRTLLDNLSSWVRNHILLENTLLEFNQAEHEIYKHLLSDIDLENFV